MDYKYHLSANFVYPGIVQAFTAAHEVISEHFNMIYKFTKALKLELMMRGVAMTILLGLAHPRGPEISSLRAREVLITSKQTRAKLVFETTQTARAIDRATSGSYDLDTQNPSIFTARYEYRGHFWQGVFGVVATKIVVVRRVQGERPWIDANSLLAAVRLRGEEATRVEGANKESARRIWQAPGITKLNGTDCILQEVGFHARAAHERHYYYIFDQDHAIEVATVLVDNSDRKGLPRSDWKARAESFATRWIDGVRYEMLTPSHEANGTSGVSKHRKPVASSRYLIHSRRKFSDTTLSFYSPSATKSESPGLSTSERPSRFPEGMVQRGRAGGGGLFGEDFAVR